MRNIEFENKEVGEYFEPISETHLEDLKMDLQKRLGIEELSDLPTKVVNPGDYLFDFQEAQNKLYMHAKSFDAYKAILAKYGLEFPLRLNEADSVQALREVAQKEDVELDGTFPGFAYNIAGKFIMYPAIKNEEILNMANKYSGKEGMNRSFDNEIEARAFLKELAEKYFYHEVGHFVYMHLLSQDSLNEWDIEILANEDIVQKVLEVQKDKHPNPESIPICNEAFADFFGEYSNPGNYDNRLGNWPEFKTLVAKIVENIK